MKTGTTGLNHTKAHTTPPSTKVRCFLSFGIEVLYAGAILVSSISGLDQSPSSFDARHSSSLHYLSILEAQQKMF
jgi:hypothetical protein